MCHLINRVLINDHFCLSAAADDAESAVLDTAALALPYRTRQNMLLQDWLVTRHSLPAVHVFKQHLRELSCCWDGRPFGHN